jgi:aspartyl aminopeptidase
MGAGLEERPARLAASFCISADAGHAVHPNYAERHDPANHPSSTADPC